MAKRKYTTAEVAAWETYCRLGHSFEETAQKFNVPAGTIRQTASRQKWRQCDLSQERRSYAATVAHIVTETWAEKAEAHRKAVFAQVSGAMQGATLQAPKNWRDFDTADKIARRAAGLEDSDGQRTLVNIGILRGPDPALPGE